MTQLEYYQNLAYTWMINLEDQIYHELVTHGMDESKADREANEIVREVCDISLDEYQSIVDHYYEDAYNKHMDDLAEKEEDYA